jgi:mRNA interferase RelE/StbE
MPGHVEVMVEAIGDLRGYAATGNLPLFFKKLLRLEEVGQDAGLPLGHNLAGWRKIVVGDRNWRIVFRMNAEATIATVWEIGDRDDAACYDEAQRRLTAWRPPARDDQPGGGHVRDQPGRARRKEGPPTRVGRSRNRRRG